MTFSSAVAGIPCQIRVTHYEPYEPATFHEPASGGELEYDVLDRRGYPAPWLERKLTDEDDTRILKEYEAILKDERDEAKIDLYLTQRNAWY